LTEKKKPLVNLESLARSYTEEAVRQVAAVLSNDTDTGRRLHAASILLDRGWGKPKQSLIGGGGGDGPLIVEIIHRARK
jgi:hypothetical protein